MWGWQRKTMSKIFSAATIGLDAVPIEVESDISNGLPGFVVVGLPDTAVQESRERVRVAIKNSGFSFPRTKIAVNLAPADIKKAGPLYDLPMAVSLLCSSGELNLNSQKNESFFVGELALNGNLRPVNGILSIATKLQKLGAKNFYLPEDNAKEASLVPGFNIYPIKNLAELVKHLKGEELITPLVREKVDLENYGTSNFDMAFVKGQEHAKRALEIAAAGGHNILMTGPPGSGKTLLSRTLPTILPRPILEEALEVTKIWSIAGLLPTNTPIIKERPFRSPHHTSSGVALVGGGAWPRPGEISLAHRGVLFLDEFPEFSRSVLENLRQPLEDGYVTVSRASGTLQFPAKFILVAAQNPCPCGYHNDSSGKCICSPAQILKYQKKISGPLLDRIDLHINVPKIDFKKLEDDTRGESSVSIRTRIQKARDIQTTRFKNKRIITNSEMSSQMIKEICKIDEASKNLLRLAVEKQNLSARSYFRILKIARTIADLEGIENINSKHVAEALQYRPQQE